MPTLYPELPTAKEAGFLSFVLVKLLRPGVSPALQGKLEQKHEHAEILCLLSRDSVRPPSACTKFR